MLNRQREHEIAVQEQELLSYIENKAYKDREQQLNIEKFQADQKDKDRKAMERVAKKEEDRRKQRFWPGDVDDMKDYLEEGGALPDFAYGAALGALGKKDAARRAVDPPGMPEMREFSVGKKEFEARDRIRDADYRERTRPPVDEVNEIAAMNREVIRGNYKNYLKDKPIVDDERKIRKGEAKKALAPKTVSERLQIINKASEMFEGHGVMAIARIGSNLRNSITLGRGNIREQIRSSIERGIADVKLKTERDIQKRLDHRMVAGLRMAMAKLLNQKEVMHNLFSYIMIPNELKEVPHEQLIRDFAVAYVSVVNSISFK